MVRAVLDQSEIVESTMELRLEWWAIFGPLYFELSLELFFMHYSFAVKIVICLNIFLAVKIVDKCILYK